MSTVEKKMVRVLHTADVHLGLLGDRACQNLQAMVKLGIQSKVNLVVIAGDFFDNNRVEDDLVMFAIKELEALAVPVVILPGNHDCLAMDSVYNRGAFPEGHSNIHVIRAMSGETLNFFDAGVIIWGKPVASYFDMLRQPFAGISSPSENGAWNIVVAHGSCFDSGLSEVPTTVDENMAARWDYIALGHEGYFKCLCDAPVKAYYADSSWISPYSSVNIVEFAKDTGVRVTRCRLDNLSR